MKKSVCGLFFALAFAAALSALEVNRPELEESGSVDTVQFENYGGPHAVIDTAAAIVNIGTELGLEVAQDLENFAVIRPDAKYSLIHAVDSSVAEKLDADILILNKNAGVDHIKNLRRIITGYLQAAYDYESEDAEVIATFITVYNAVYRNDIATFEERYKQIVLDNVTEDKVGLSTVWSDWAGNSQIVIPLNDVQGGISAVDTTVISDENVVEALRQEEDKAVDLREDMLEIKEKETVNATEKAQEAQKAAAQERKEGNQEKAEEFAQESAEQQEIADRKTEEVKVEQKELEEDMKELGMAVPEVEDTSSYLTGLFVVNEASNLYTLITVNGITGEVIRKSSVNQIKGKTVYVVSDITITQEGDVYEFYDDMYLAMCGIDDGHSAPRLCLIDSSALELKKQSDEILSDSSELIERNGDYYVIVKSDGKHYVACYSKDLMLKNISTLEVSPSTPLNMLASGILVTDVQGNPRMLDASLAEIW
ncbi:MAG: hypothetical protein K6G00_11980 [Treponema sp.]|nr:hypothetical protein [Treponema sp.]